MPVFCQCAPLWVVECHTPFACGMYIHYTCVCTSLCTYKSSCTPAFPLVLTQWGNTALLRAAHGGSVPLVRALLEEYGSTLDEVDVVSCSSNVRCYLVPMSEVCLVACSVQL